MTKLLTLPVLALAAATASTASAQSGPDLQYSGVIMVESIFSAGSSSDTYVFADLDFDIAFANLGSGPTIGFSGDYTRVASEADAGGFAHAGLYADFGNSRITLGIPQGSYQIYRGRSLLENSGVFALELSALLMNPVSDYVQLALDEYAFGAQYDGSFGAWDVSASFAQADLSGSLISFGSASAQYTFSDALSVWASVESVEESGVTETRYAAGLTGSMDAFDYSLTYSESIFFPADVVDASLIYHVNDRLEIGLGGFWFTNGFSDTLYAVSAEYGIGERYFVRGSVFMATGDDPISIVNMGIKF